MFGKALLAGTLVCGLFPVAGAADEFGELRLRWRRKVTGDAAQSVESTARREWGSLQKAAGSAGMSRAYGRLRDMAVAWATPGQALYQDAGLLADTIFGMEWMDANRYNARSIEYDSWWDWEIGTPAEVVDIGILLYDRLSAEQLSRYMAAVERFDSDPRVLIFKVPSTGANLADKCKIAILRGLLLNDAAAIARAAAALSPVFEYVTSGDGFYADGSFLQHKRHPYTGSYGVVLLDDMADLMYLLAGSRWDFTEGQRATVRRWATDSFTPLLYEGAMMDMVRGRAISRQNYSDRSAGDSAIAALQILQDASTTPAARPAISRVYASMDRVVHVRRTWAAGIAMHSSRIFNYEGMDGENLKGWHTSDGMTYLYNADLRQFTDAFWPTVDPQRLPGTTVIAGSTARESRLGGSDAVGGTSLDGYSAAMMLLAPEGGQLSAKKSWFLFDDELVALGAEIRSTAAAQTVETIMENRRLTAEARFTSGQQGRWAHLASAVPGASVGYYFPDKAAWKSLEKTRSGAWSEINRRGPATAVGARYRTLWFDHGRMPDGATYAYVILPGKSQAETVSYAGSPGVRIVENNGDVQAVVEAGLGIRAANFWTGAKSAAGIGCDGVASVLVHEANGVLTIAASDPTQANTGRLHIEVAEAAGAVVFQDAGVSVEQTTPVLRLAIWVKDAHGKPFRVAARMRTAP
ncbi:MAG: polysaccharide lyase 8 family protein [Bryobacteraceae bacterium]